MLPHKQAWVRPKIQIPFIRHSQGEGTTGVHTGTPASRMMEGRGSEVKSTEPGPVGLAWAQGVLKQAEEVPRFKGGEGAPRGL